MRISSDSGTQLTCHLSAYHMLDAVVRQKLAPENYCSAKLNCGKVDEVSMRVRRKYKLWYVGPCTLVKNIPSDPWISRREERLC